jgi:hypothetical protein
MLQPSRLPILALVSALLAAGCQSAPKDAQADGAAVATAAPGAPGAPDAPVASATPAPAPGAPDAAKASKKDEPKKDEAGKGEELTDAQKKLKEKEDKEKKELEEAKKKWDDLTEKLTRNEGFFTTWNSDTVVLLELDKGSFGREFLYVGSLGSGAGNNSVYRGAMLSDNEFVLRFERRGEKKVVLLASNDRFLEPGDSFEQKMLDEVTSESVLQAFDLAAENKEDGKVLVNLGDWFMSDNMQVGNGIGGKFQPSKDLSSFPSLRNYPRNVEIDQSLTFTGQRGQGNLTIADGRGVTLKLHHSLCALPGDGFKVRAADQRVGFFTTERKDIFDIRSDDPVRRYINHWRLQKKDPSAEVSDPVEPITYWIENTTPKEWRPAVKAAIEMWEPAFRKAGFSNAIVAKQMPEDADWDPGDIRYSVVRWSSDENVGFAIGPSRTDPRTGEIFDADITMQANFLAIYRERFETFVQDLATMSKDEVLARVDAQYTPAVPENDDMARLCMLQGPELVQRAAQAATIKAILTDDFDPDAFLSAMLTEVVAHEVGHTLGLRHNFKSSTWLGLDELADVASTAQRGLVGSVMDYTAINIASPEHRQGEYFASSVGPYDVWAIEYGYTEFGNNDAGGLAAIAARSHEPGLDYGTDEDMILGDPYAQQWDLGRDPVAFAAEQIALAEKGFSKLAERGAEKGEGFHRYSRFYAMFTTLYNRAYQGLDRFLWAVETNRDVVGQENGRPPIKLVDPKTQRDALQLMCTKGLTWRGGIPDSQRLLLAGKKFGSFGEWFDPWSFDPMPRIVNSSRYYVLSTLTSTGLFERLGSQAALVGAGAVTPREVADCVFSTVWVAQEPDLIDRWTQTDYLDLVFRGIKAKTAPDVSALMNGQLDQVEVRARAYAGSANAEVKAHGDQLLQRIDRYRKRQVTENF